MKPILCTLILLLLITPCFSQSAKEDVFYLWNSKWQNVPVVDSATYFSRLKQVDSVWQFDTYKLHGPMITSEQFKDKACQILHGRFAGFRTNGTLDSVGHCHNGKQHGDWYFYSDSGTVALRKKYSFGELLSVDQPKPRDSSQKSDAQEKESSFPGGLAGWNRFLTRNLKYPEQAQKLLIMGTVTGDFIVNAEGKVEAAFISKSVEFSLDEELLRLLRKSPKWNPATQFGRKVKSYKRQPLIFKLE